jgi:hypothetical protein
MLILTLIERETLQVFVYILHKCSMCLLGVCEVVPPLPANLQDLRDRITAAVARVDRDMLTHVWNVMDYRIKVCRIRARFKRDGTCLR